MEQNFEKLRIIAGSEIEPREVEWLWYPYIPYGKVTMIQGDPGEGKETKEFLEDLTTRDQRMMFAVLTLVHMADTKKQLDDDTEAIMTAARKKLCQLSILKWQQMDGLNTALPVGVRKIKVMRTLTTESLL